MNLFLILKFYFAKIIFLLLKQQIESILILFLKVNFNNLVPSLPVEPITKILGVIKN